MEEEEIRYCSKCNQVLLAHEKDICDMCKEDTNVSSMMK